MDLQEALADETLIAPLGNDLTSCYGRDSALRLSLSELWDSALYLMGSHRQLREMAGK